jgi:transcription elongation factor Elf1
MPSPLAMLFLVGACPACEQKTETSRVETIENDEKIILVVCNNCGATIDKEWPGK